MKKKLRLIFILIVLLLISGASFVFYTGLKENLFSCIKNNKSSDEKKDQPTEMTFIIGGDAMFGRLVDYQFKNNLQSSLENLGENFFGGKDLSLVNLEGPISDFPTNPSTDPNNLIFNFPPETTQVLKWLGVNAASLANNHSSNQGKTGFENTKNALEQEGIVPIGQEFNFNEDSIARFKKGDNQISVIAINTLETEADITQAIAQEKQAKSFVIIFPHWGGEYQTIHSKSQENLAHAWIDAGADLIIGSHSHVIQDAEIYNNKPIFYSLGNLIFDQTFSSETQQGLIISGKILNNKLTLTLIPTIQKNLKPELMEGDQKQEIINRLEEQMGIPSGQDTFEMNL